MQYSQAIKSQQHLNFGNALNNQKFTDTTFVIGAEKEEFSVNRLLLSSISTKFHKLFINADKKCHQLCMDADPNGFQCVVNYAYANDPNLNEKNVLSVLYICQKYDIPLLLNLCEEYFTKNICANNVCILLNEAVRLKLISYSAKCTSYVTKNPSEVLHITETEGFLQLSLEAMKLILQMNELAIDENILWAKIVTWADYQSKAADGNELKNDPASTKAEILKKIRHEIRFGLMDGAYFTQHVATQNVLTQEELLNVLMYKQVKTLGCIFNLTKRRTVDKYSSVEECKHELYIVYNEKSKEEQRCIIHAQLESKLCDRLFVISKNNKDFRVNRLFLATISPVFEAMLYGNMKESEMNSTVQVPDVDSDAFQCVLNYAYCGNPNITYKEVLDVYYICDKYQIEFLKNECCKYFSKCMTTKNICYLLDRAVALKIDSVVTKIVNKLNKTKDMKQIFNSKGFCDMKLEPMRLFLDCKLPFAEEVIWDRILQWANHQSSKVYNTIDEKEETKGDEIDTEKSICLLKSVRDLIRFGLMNGKYFANKVAQLNVLKQEELIEVLLYFQDPTIEIKSFKMKRRIPKPKSEIEKLHEAHDKEIGLLTDKLNSLTAELNTYHFSCKNMKELSFKLSKLSWNDGGVAGFDAKFGKMKIIHSIVIGNKDIEVRLSPFCICGNTLMKATAEECYNSNSVECNHCQTTSIATDIVWHCNREKIRQHKRGYDLCMSCATCGALNIDTQDQHGNWTPFLQINLLQKGEIKKFNVSVMCIAMRVYNRSDKSAGTTIDHLKIFGHGTNINGHSKRSTNILGCDLLNFSL